MSTPEEAPVSGAVGADGRVAHSTTDAGASAPSRAPGATTASPAARATAILRERARTLARRPTSQAGETLEVVVFTMGAERYAFESGQVKEVHVLRHLTPIPCTPPFILGVVNVRGEMCTVIDLKGLLGLPKGDLTNATHALIVRVGPQELAIVADVVVGVRAIPRSGIAPPPTVSGAGGLQCLAGVAQDGTAVLDAVAILAHPALIVDQQVAQ